MPQAALNPPPSPHDHLDWGCLRPLRNHRYTEAAMAQDEDLAFQRSLWEHRTAPSRTPSTRPQGLLAASNHSSGSILFIDEIYVVSSSRHGRPPATDPISVPHAGGTHVGTAMIRALVESYPHALSIHLITPCAPHPDQNGAIPSPSSTHPCDYLVPPRTHQR